MDTNVEPSRSRVCFVDFFSGRSEQKLRTVVACTKEDRGKRVDPKVEPPVPDLHESATTTTLRTKKITDVAVGPEPDKSIDGD